MAPRTRGMAAAEAALAPTPAPLSQPTPAPPATTTETESSPASAPNEKKSSPLLELPAELRNRIYRLTLLEDAPLPVSPQGYARPALINTCKQIRSEALKIFYYEQEFTIDAAGYDTSTILAWETHLKALDLTVLKCRTSVTGLWRTNPNWNNLFEWLKSFNGGELTQCYRRPIEIAQHPLANIMVIEDFVIGGLFAIAFDLRGDKWEKVEKLLLEQRAVLAKIDHRWNED